MLYFVRLWFCLNVLKSSVWRSNYCNAWAWVHEIGPHFLRPLSPGSWKLWARYERIFYLKFLECIKHLLRYLILCLYFLWANNSCSVYCCPPESGNILYASFWTNSFLGKLCRICGSKSRRTNKMQSWFLGRSRFVSWDMTWISILCWPSLLYTMWLCLQEELLSENDFQNFFPLVGWKFL